MSSIDPVPVAGGPNSPAARSIARIEAGRCNCEGCAGVLAPASEDTYGWSRCRTCNCRHYVSVVFGERYACWIPDWTGRCPNAERKRRGDRAEQLRQERRRRTIEARDDR